MRELENRLQHIEIIAVVKRMSDITGRATFYRMGTSVYAVRFRSDNTGIFIDTKSLAITLFNMKTFIGNRSAWRSSSRIEFTSVLAQVCEVYLAMLNRKTK